MEDRLITTKEVGNYRIKIYYNTDMECPCKSWDIEEMDWYDLREHANTMSDFIQKLYNYI